MFHRIKSVTPLNDYILLAHFIDGTDKTYDLKMLFEQIPVFKSFESNPSLYKLAKADVGGYGVVWNEEIDLDAEEIWQNGQETKTAFSGLIAMSDATNIWGLNESTLRKSIAYGKLIPGIDAFNFGNQWVVTEKSMNEKYGEKLK